MAIASATSAHDIQCQIDCVYPWPRETVEQGFWSLSVIGYE